MSRSPQAESHTVRADLLARLGLSPEADADDVTRAHAEIVEFLDGAPDSVRGWAERRTREVDRVTSLLTGPADELTALERRPDTRRAGVPKPVLWLGAALLGVALVVGVYWLGRPPETPAAMGGAAGSASGQQVTAVDEAKVAALKARVAANPQDTATLQQLSNLYYAAGDLAEAQRHLDAIFAYDPTNEKALIGAGATAFNSGDAAAAETFWNRAAELYPANPEVHYNLGFLHMTLGRADLMRAEWDTVVRLAPDSELAATITTHLRSLTAASASASPTPSK